MNSSHNNVSPLLIVVTPNFTFLTDKRIDEINIENNEIISLNSKYIPGRVKNTMEKVERIQYQAALAISGAWHGSSRIKLYEELGWEILSDRRMCRRILRIHNIFNDKTPSYLKDKLPPNCRALFSGNIRNAFHEIICKSI